MSSNYIPDGYTETGYIKAVPRLHDSLKFEYRVMMSDQIREVLHQWEQISAAEQTRRIHGVIKTQVKSWDLKHGDEILPINGGNLSRMKRNLVEKLFNIVMQLSVPDEIEQDEELDLDQVLGGNSDEKN